MAQEALLVTLDEVKLALTYDGMFNDGQIDFWISQATGIIYDYLKLGEAEEPGWPVDWFDSSLTPTAEYPRAVKQAAILVVSMLAEKPMENPITAGVESLLRRQRDPAME